MNRDMTQAQFDKRTTELGFKREGFLGYYKLPPPCESQAISIYNAGNNRRAQLAYLLREFDSAQSAVSAALERKE